jgi:type III secretion protein V
MNNFLLALPGRPEASLAAVLIGIVMVLVMPLSREVLDILTVISLSSGLLVLLMAVRVQSPVQMLTFPALLLITTMLRLSLNVASTKMILLEGRAGHVIETFGRVVMGDNLLVGLCVFGIVSVVQFLVVAKGADRVAEVGARFSLDAMPGKQMSIDGEMRAGTLSPEEASRRRDRLDIESRFFGGMDGAMKFVKGDAIAGLIIALVNILGGLASGMSYHGMSASVALTRYATLSVGDAMVSQIPSFTIAVAAGLITTRVTSSQGEQADLGRQIFRDLERHPSSLLYVGAFCIGLALVPGFPVIAFLGLGLAAIAGSVGITRAAKRREALAPGFDRPMASFTPPGAAKTPTFINREVGHFDAPIVITLPHQLAERVDTAVLDARMTEARTRLKQQWGAPYPGVKCCLAGEDSASADSAKSGSGTPQDGLTIEWHVNGNPTARVTWHESRVLTLGMAEPHDDGPLGFPGFPEAQWDGAASSGDGIEVVLARVTEHICLREGARLLTHEEFHELMLELKTTHPQLAEGLSAVVPLPVLTDAVRSLLREGIGLRALPQICDNLLAFAPLPQDANSIAEKIVTSLSRARCAEAAPDGVLRAHMVDPVIETVLRNYAMAQEQESAEAGSPDMDAFREVRRLLSQLAAANPRGRIHLLCRSTARLMVSELAYMVSSRYRVFSFRGVNPRFGIQVLSTIRLSDESIERLKAETNLLQDPEVMEGNSATESGAYASANMEPDDATFDEEAFFNDEEPAKSARSTASRHLM